MFDGLINIIAYLFLIIVAVMVIITERKDNTCPSFDATQEECNEGGPMCYSWTKPNTWDSVPTILRKIKTCSKANSSSVKWRRIFITSFGIIIGLWLVVSLFVDNGDIFIPDWRITYLCFVVVYTILFSTSNYYDFHLYKGAEENIDGNIKNLEKKLNQ